MKTIQTIIEMYKSGKMHDDIDESGAGGLWDYIGEALPTPENSSEQSFRDKCWEAIYKQILQDIQ